MSAAKHGTDGEDSVVPLFGSWRNAYLAVVAVFLFDVALFYALSRIFE